jgi:hypothetical protein
MDVAPNKAVCGCGSNCNCGPSVTKD